MAYLLDANVLIDAKNRHYGFDFCPAFWDWIVQSHSAGQVCSIERVGVEIQAGRDDLSTWASGLPAGFFMQPDQSVFPALAAASAWANGGNYQQSAVHTFMQSADYYLVAQAIAGSHVVVTHEIPAATPKKIKIPDACIGLRVRFMTPFQMLRVLGARFVLGNPRS
ncbi:MAG: DUF4411 family protein [Pseudomonadota bacterium]